MTTRTRTALALGAALLVALAAATVGPADAAPVSPYVVNGGPTSITARPYQVAILDLRNGATAYRQFHCGGSVVAPTIVLTAGHCAYDQDSSGNFTTPTGASNLQVLTGTSSLSSGGTRTQVASVIVHPNYDPHVSDRYDAALFVLANPVSATPVRVVPGQSDYRWNSGRAVGTVSGWGCANSHSDCSSDADYPTLIRSATMPIHSDAWCSGVNGLYQAAFERTSMLCAGLASSTADAPGACYGDSGGPLTVPGITGDLLVGIVSWGYQCGGTPTVFGRVANFRGWLASNGVPIASGAFRTGPSSVAFGVGRPVVGDFDGDAHGDVLVYRPGSAPDPLLFGAGGGALGAGPTQTINGNYRTAVCDLDGDGRDDIVFHGPGKAPDAVWLGTGANPAFTTGPRLVINGNYLPVAGDFDGDGVCDLFLYGPGTAPDRLLPGNGDGSFGTPLVQTVNGTYTPVVGDFDGNGIAEILWYARGVTMPWWRGTLVGFDRVTAPAIAGTLVPAAGDIDGDGTTDLVWYGPGTNRDLVWNATGTGFTRGADLNVGGAYTPALTDIDGDGHADVVWATASSASPVWLGR